MTTRLQLLRTIRDASARTLEGVRCGDVGARGIVEFVTYRQNLVDSLATFDGSTHDEERAVAHEIAALDQELVRYCEECRSNVAKQIVRQTTAKPAPGSQHQPKIISQRA